MKDYPFKGFKEISENINKFAEKRGSNSLSNLPAFTKSSFLENHIYKKFECQIEKFKEFFKDYPYILIEVAKHGWYLDFETDFDLPKEIAGFISNEEFNKMEVLLTDYYTNNFNKTINKLITHHENRKNIFGEIKKGFEAEYYYMTSCLLLTQVDGVCNDIFKKSFFLKHQKGHEKEYLPKVSDEIEKLSDETLKFFISPFLNKSPIFAHRNHLIDFPCTFNRHLDKPETIVPPSPMILCHPNR